MIQAVSERSGAKERSENREEALRRWRPDWVAPMVLDPGDFTCPSEEPGSLTRQFDLDGDGKLNKDERTAARQELRANSTGAALDDAPMAQSRRLKQVCKSFQKKLSIMATSLYTTVS